MCVYIYLCVFVGVCILICVCLSLVLVLVVAVVDIEPSSISEMKQNKQVEGFRKCGAIRQV